MANNYAFTLGSVPGFPDQNPPLDQLIVRNGGDILRSPTIQSYPGAGGTEVRIQGFGLTYDANGKFTGGIITSISVVQIDQFQNVTLVENTNFFGGVPAINYQNALNISTLDAIQLVHSGNDVMNGSAGNDLIQGWAGSDVLSGNDGNDRLEGGTGADDLFGGFGDDHLVGGAGSDDYNGGAGFDTVDYSDSYGNPAANQGVFINAGANFAVDWQGNGESLVSIESFIGTQFVDVMLGDGSDETFRGLGGLDFFDGNGGSDTVAYDLDASKGGFAGVTVNLTTQTATDGFGNNDSFADIENATGSNANDNLTGNTGSNVLRGLGGDDRITGVAGGFDTMIGGAGNDTYVYDTNFFQVVDEEQDNGSGIDTVETSVSISLSDTSRFKGAVENVNMVGAANLFVFGNDLDNVINGNVGDNFIRADSGNDTVNGGIGNDNIGGEGGNDVLDGGAGEDIVDGGLGNDVVRGGLGDDILTGGAGNDVMDGGLGADVLNGGLGNDTYVLTNEPDGQDAIDDDGGVDTITTTISRSLVDFGSNSEDHIENLTLLGTALNGSGNDLNNVITGNALNNVLSGLGGNDTLNGLGGNDSLLGGDGNDTLNGGDGNDTLNGGAGADALRGGAGNDVYRADSADSISDTAGIDRVDIGSSANLLSFTGIENLNLTGTGNINGTGNNGNNVINGNIGNNTLIGLGGNDTLSGGFGNDRLSGGVGNDTLRGGDGNDRLSGGVGHDNLTGGTDFDTFVFDAARSSANSDVVTDFSHFFDTFALENSIYTQLGASITSGEFKNGAATQADDHILYNKATGVLVYDTNGNGAGGATVLAVLSNHASLDYTDFALV